jgi:hypothetical protein
LAFTRARRRPESRHVKDSIADNLRLGAPPRISESARIATDSAVTRRNCNARVAARNIDLGKSMNAVRSS